MSPPPIILDEDAYTAAIAHIIQRDFFPDLPHLRRTNDSLVGGSWDPAAVSSAIADRLPADQARVLAGQLLASSSHLGRGEVPSSVYSATMVAGDADPSSFSTPPCDIDLSLSLDEFLAAYTSEDNASFNEVMAVGSVRHREKHAWAYNGSNRLLLPKPAADIPHQASSHAALAADADINPEVGLVVYDAGVPKPSKSWASASASSGGTLSALMFGPDNHCASSSSLLNESQARGEYRKIVHGNTIIPETEAVDASPSIATASVLAVSPSRRSAAFINVPSMGYVPQTPVILPESLHDGPIMTWGEIASTPAPLRRSNTPAAATPRTFRILPTSRRDLLAHRLADKAGASLRRRRQIMTPVLQSPGTGDGGGRAWDMTPQRDMVSSGRTRTPMLSAAAQRMLRRSVGISDGQGDAMLRASYSRSRGSSLAGTPAGHMRLGQTPRS